MEIGNSKMYAVIGISCAPLNGQYLIGRGCAARGRDINQRENMYSRKIYFHRRASWLVWLSTEKENGRGWSVITRFQMARASASIQTLGIRTENWGGQWNEERGEKRNSPAIFNEGRHVIKDSRELKEGFLKLVSVRLLRGCAVAWRGAGFK